jgi:hypothetical protein
VVSLAALALALAPACSFTGPGVAGGDAGSDAPPPDGADDGAARSCLDRWRDGTVALASPTLLAAISSPQMDRDPYVTSDELTMYFSSYRTGAQAGDVYVATRDSTSDMFGAPQRRDDISSPSADSRFTMARNEIVGIVSSDRAGTEGASDLWISVRLTRQSPFPPFVQMGLDNVNSNNSELDPELSADGLHLYLAIGSPQRLALSVRPNLAASFGSTRELDELLSNAGEADPSVSADERVIVFASRRTSGGGEPNGDLWYARRASAEVPFEAPVRLAAVSSTSGDGDPALSADGCHLYFASDRTGDWQLYVAAVTP